jgi:hypothetical protein
MNIQVKLEVCSACHCRCTHCAHQGLRAFDPHYQLSLADLETFIQVTEESGYAADIYMHGPGEPLLWRHLAEGLAMLRGSTAISSIIINSNGIALPSIIPLLDLVDQMRISTYPGVKIDTIMHPKIVYNPHPVFIRKFYPAAIPCLCLCNGPMVYKDLLFPWCGPPLFDAVLLANTGRDPLSFATRLAPRYADNLAHKSGTFSECSYCWSNSNCQYTYEAHSTVVSAG